MRKEEIMYFLLREGEIIQEHDEYYDPTIDKWRVVSSKRINTPYEKEVNDHIIMLRRKNKAFRYPHKQWI
jgi:hypothetical protein